MKKFIFILIILGIGFGAFYLYGSISNRDISLELKKDKEEIRLGEPFDLEVIFENNSNNRLNNVRVSINLPENIISEESGESINISRDLGDIDVGGVHRETVSVIAIPSEDPNYKIESSVVYSPEAIVADFKKKDDLEIEISNFDFELELNSPEKIFRGEDFEIIARYKTEEELEELNNIGIRIDFPETFKIKEESPARDEKKDTWEIKEDKESEVIITGNIELIEEESFEIKANLIINILGEEYVFMSELVDINVEPSSLSLEVVLAERVNTINPGEKVTYAILYNNNTNIVLRDIVINAKLTGEMFDINSIETNGSFNKSLREITWTKNDTDKLDNLMPNESGQITFSIKTKESHPINQINDKNFLLIVDSEIESPTVPSFINTEKTFSSAKIESKVSGLILVDVDVLFRDIGTGVINNGPFPPRVGSPTNYTVHWGVSNFGTDVSNVEIRTRLEDGVIFKGVVKNNTDKEPEYDTSSKEIIWRLGDLLATTGVLSEKPEIVFQIEATPKSSDINKYMSLIGETRVSAEDKFIEKTISSISDSATTRLENDNTVNENDGKVVN